MFASTSIPFAMIFYFHDTVCGEIRRNEQQLTEQASMQSTEQASMQSTQEAREKFYSY